MSRDLIWSVFREFALLRDALSWVALRDRLRYRASRARLMRKAAQSGVSVGSNVEVIGLERLIFGEGTVIQSNVTLHCGGMDWSEGKGAITIGRNGFIGHGCVLYGGGGIQIGDDVLISPGVIIASHQHSHVPNAVPMRLQPKRFAPVSIGANVWIGSGAVILPGVAVDRGAVIAAGAVVSRSVPAYTLAAGVPARTVKSLRESDNQTESRPSKT
jgi:acetyltransferase-like isoleucine patch superfamily enzyme